MILTQSTQLGIVIQTIRPYFLNKAVYLFSLQQNNDFMIYHTDEPTHFPHSGRTPSTIDLVLSNISSPIELTTHNDQMQSDHRPVISTNGEFERPVLKRYDYSKADWNKYRRIMDHNINSITSLESIDEIDRSIESFTKYIYDARANSIPLQRIIFHTAISPETRQLIQLKNTLRRR